MEQQPEKKSICNFDNDLIKWIAILAIGTAVPLIATYIFTNTLKTTQALQGYSNPLDQPKARDRPHPWSKVYRLTCAMT